jgi:transcriptional regulator with XRE-family HTH domain
LYHDGAESFGKAVGRRIREQRELSGLTQRELSYRCGLDVITVSRIERGARLPSLSTLILLAKALQTDAGTILSYVQSLPSAPQLMEPDQSDYNK